MDLLLNIAADILRLKIYQKNALIDEYGYTTQPLQTSFLLIG